MNMDELNERVTKLEFHIRKLLEDSNLAKFYVSSNLSENDTLNLIKIFNSIENELNNGKQIDWISNFEIKLQYSVGIGRQNLKSLILILYNESRYVNICREYMKSTPCVEFDDIVKNNLGGYYR